MPSHSLGHELETATFTPHAQQIIKSLPCGKRLINYQSGTALPAHPYASIRKIMHINRLQGQTHTLPHTHTYTNILQTAHTSLVPLALNFLHFWLPNALGMAKKNKPAERKIAHGSKVMRLQLGHRVGPRAERGRDE